MEKKTLVDVINQQLYPNPVPNEVDSDYVVTCSAMQSEGDGLLMGALFKNKLFYATSSATWYVWHGHVWRRDKVNLILGLVRCVVERYGQEITILEEKIEKSRKENDPENHKIFARGWRRKINQYGSKINALRQEKGRNACVKFSHTHYQNPFSIEGNEFDKDPWLLGVQNGVIDLRSGELSLGEPQQMVSKQCSCNLKVFAPETKEEEIAAWLAPWLHFLDTIYAGDTEIIEFMQILLGYGLTGLTTDHVFPFLLGRGRNGKSLFITAVMRVMGDYAATIPCDLFLKSNQPRAANQTDPGIMKLEGLRLAVSSEVEEGSRFSSKNVKRLTGGDNLEGRNPYDKELREFKPTHLNLMIGNYEPVPPSGDLAFWDRTFLINHPVRFVKASPDPEKNEKLADPEIEDKLQQLDEQILYWLVEGCLKWQRAGKKIIPPASVLKATDEYQADADWIGRFIDDCCERSDTKTGSTELYLAFAEWYRETIDSRKDRTPSQRIFGQKIKANGEFIPHRISNGVFYCGITLNSTWQNRMEAYPGERQ